MAPGSSPSVSLLSSSGFEIAYPGPPPAAPVATSPVPVTAPTVTPIAAHPVKGRHHRRRVKTKLRLGWRWHHRRSRLEKLFIGHLPRHGKLTVSCTGKGCGRRRSRQVKAGHVQRMINALLGHTYHAGDRLRIEIRAPGYEPLRAVVHIRDGHKPRVVVLRDRTRQPHHQTHHHRHHHHHGGRHGR